MTVAIFVLLVLDLPSILWMKTFIWGFLLGKSSGHNKTIFFIKMAEWWISHFSPHFPLKFVVVEGRANFVSCFVIANYLYKNAMLTWRQSWSDLPSFTSSNQWRETAMKKENEKHWDFIANTSRRQINSSRRRMPVSFYRFLRYVSVNTISSVSLWILMRTKTLCS